MSQKNTTLHGAPPKKLAIVALGKDKGNIEEALIDKYRGLMMIIDVVVVYALGKVKN